MSAPDFHDWKAQSRSFEAMGYYAGGEWSVTVDGAADYVMVFRVTPGFLEALRAAPAMGRLFSDEELRTGGPSVVITDAYWKRQFGGRPNAIGKTLKYNDRVFTVVGVLAPGVRFPIRAEMYVPPRSRTETGRSGHNYRALGRLRDAVSIEQAQSGDDRDRAAARNGAPGVEQGQARAAPLRSRRSSSATSSRRSGSSSRP